MKKYIVAVMFVFMLCLVWGAVCTASATNVRARRSSEEAKNIKESPLPNEKERTEVCNFVASIPFRERDKYIVSYGVFDANNDGVSDVIEPFNTTSNTDKFLVRTTNGKERIWQAGRVSSQNSGLDIWATGAAWFLYNGRTYLIHFNDQSEYFPTHITYISPDDRSHLLCTFQNEIKEHFAKDYSEQEYGEICEIVASDRRNEIKYVDLDIREPDEIMKKYFWGIHDNEKMKLPINYDYLPIGLLKLDFDNDGNKDDLGIFGHSSARGFGCDYREYALVKEDGSPSTSTYRDKMLWNLQFTNPDMHTSREHCDIAYQRWFSFKGITFLETRPRRLVENPSRSKLFHDVSYIRDNAIHRVCRATFDIQTNLGTVITDTMENEFVFNKEGMPNYLKKEQKK